LCNTLLNFVSGAKGKFTLIFVRETSLLDHPPRQTRQNTKAYYGLIYSPSNNAKLNKANSAIARIQHDAYAFALDHPLLNMTQIY
jgi:hypothetical protein